MCETGLQRHFNHHWTGTIKKKHFQVIIKYNCYSDLCFNVYINIFVLMFKLLVCHFTVQLGLHQGLVQILIKVWFLNVALTLIVDISMKHLAKCVINNNIIVFNLNIILWSLLNQHNKFHLWSTLSCIFNFCTWKYINTLEQCSIL